MTRRLKWYRVPVGVVLLICGLFGGVDRATAGQGQVNASITGRATDESGGVLPGVTVTATSPALQVPEISVVTDESGDYRLSSLPIGTYQVVYTLSGFQTVRREGLRLTAGFIVRSDVVLKVGGLEETLTVSGISPVVDAASTSSVTTLTRETLEVNPLGRSGVISLFQQSPATRGTDDLGGNKFNDSTTVRVYGIGDETKSWFVYDGIVATSAGQSAVSQYFDYSSLDEVKMQTVANDVEMPNRGVNLNMIVKSGGNDFHGSAYWEGTSQAFQSSNIDAALAAHGIKQGGNLRYRQDASYELGGRIIRDRLWFYGNVRGRKQQETVLGIFKPDGSVGTLEQAQGNWTDKFSWQMSQKQRLIFLDNFVKLWKDDAFGAPTEWSARSHKILPEHNNKLEWQWVPTSAVVLSAQVGRWRLGVDYPVRPGDVERMDIATGRTWGLNANAANRVDHWRPQWKAAMTWFLPDLFAGKHEFKVGYEDIRNTSSRGWKTRPQGNYQLLFNHGAPYEFVAYNFPNTPLTTTRSTAIYGADKWTLGRRITLNLGVRWARDDGWIPAQCREGGDFFAASCTAEIDTRIMNSWSPRLYVSYDVTGTGKTAIKGGWGRFTDWRDQDNFLSANPNIALQRTYLWHDLTNCSCYLPGDVNLDTSGPDFVSETGKGNTAISHGVVNPNEPETKEDQFSLSLEHELIKDLGIRVTGLYSRRFNVGRTANLLRGPELYTIANTRPDPGPDGILGTADDPGVSLTWYEYPAAYRSAAFQLNTRVLDPNATERFKTIEVTGSKRLSHRWQLLMSYSATKSDVPVSAESNINPNTLINTADRNWEWLGRASGVYQFAHGVQVSSTFEHRSGTVSARTVTLTGGGTIPSITLNAEPIGSIRFPNTNVTNLRVEKRFSLGGGRSIIGRVNLYNMMNVNTATALIVRSGKQFLQPSAIESPRIVTFVATYTF